MKIAGLIAATLMLFAAKDANAASVNLAGWLAENGRWGFSDTLAENDTVLQSKGSGPPAILHSDGRLMQGATLSGTMSVETSRDDDFFGFLLGYDPGELRGPIADYWLIDWKQNTAGTSIAGLALSHVTSSATSGTISTSNFWTHTNSVAEVARGATLGLSGWKDNTSYTFQLTFTADLIELVVNDVTEISHAGSFMNGNFGFYTLSQEAVKFAALTSTQVAPVPLPAGMSLMLSVGAILLLLNLLRQRTMTAPHPVRSTVPIRSTRLAE